MDAGATYNPRTVEEVFRDFKGRRAALIKALTTDVEEFYQQCDPGCTIRQKLKEKIQVGLKSGLCMRGRGRKEKKKREF
ncbi:PHD finger protein ALFIN 4 [Spatholobus suberectus]|nr:PHD finger protein ALFIN 4 [Spatholobus suberectus]